MTLSLRQSWRSIKTPLIPRTGGEPCVFGPPTCLRQRSNELPENPLKLFYAWIRLCQIVNSHCHLRPYNAFQVKGKSYKRHVACNLSVHMNTMAQRARAPHCWHTCGSEWVNIFILLWAVYIPLALIYALVYYMHDFDTHSRCNAKVCFP